MNSKSHVVVDAQSTEDTSSSNHNYNDNNNEDDDDDNNKNLNNNTSNTTNLHCCSRSQHYDTNLTSSANKSKISPST